MQELEENIGPVDKVRGADHGNGRTVSSNGLAFDASELITVPGLPLPIHPRWLNSAEVIMPLYRRNDNGPWIPKKVTPEFRQLLTARGKDEPTIFPEEEAAIMERTQTYVATGVDVFTAEAESKEDEEVGYDADGKTERKPSRKLSPRQFQSIYYQLSGLGSIEIGERLGVSDQAIKNTLSSAYKKLGVGTADGAVAKVIEIGIVDPGIFAPRGFQEGFPYLSVLEWKVYSLATDPGSSYSNKEIARNLFVSEQTIKNHMTHILAKLCLTNRTQMRLLDYQRRESERIAANGKSDLAA